jgi:hypothetical protein
LPSLLIGLVGFSYIVIAVIAYIFASIRTEDFFGGVNLVGYTYITQDVPYESGVEGKLLVGYYLTYAAGFVCIVLALLRSKIIGRALPQ